jgi:hypothetical protein
VTLIAEDDPVTRHPSSLCAFSGMSGR